MCGQWCGGFNVYGPIKMYINTPSVNAASSNSQPTLCAMKFDANKMRLCPDAQHLSGLYNAAVPTVV